MIESKESNAVKIFRIFVSFLILFLVDGFTYGLKPILTLLTENSFASHTQVSIIHSLLICGTLVISPIASISINKLGCKMTTIIGALISSICFIIIFFLIYWFQNIYFLYITFFFGGAGFSFMYMAAIVNVMFAKKLLAMSIVVCGSGSGALVFNFLNKIIIENFASEGSFFILGILVTINIVCAIIMCKVASEPCCIKAKKGEKARKAYPKSNNKNDDTNEETKNFTDNQNETTDIPSTSTAEIRKSSDKIEKKKLMKGFRNYLSYFKNANYICFVVFNIFTNVGLKAPITFIYAQSISLGLENHQAEWVFYAIGLANIIGKLVIVIVILLVIKFSKITFEKSKKIILYNIILLLICGIATLISGIFDVSGIIVKFARLLTFSILIGLTSGGYDLLRLLVLVNLYRDDQKEKINSFGFLVLVEVASLVWSLTYHKIKSYAIPFLIGGAFISFSSLICFFIYYRLTRDTDTKKTRP